LGTVNASLVNNNTKVPEIPAIKPTVKPGIIEKIPEASYLEPQQISGQ
jgi:hypothetical protein